MCSASAARKPKCHSQDPLVKIPEKHTVWRGCESESLNDLNLRFHKVTSRIQSCAMFEWIRLGLSPCISHPRAQTLLGRRKCETSIATQTTQAIFMKMVWATCEQQAFDTFMDVWHRGADIIYRVYMGSMGMYIYIYMISRTQSSSSMSQHLCLNPAACLNIWSGFELLGGEHLVLCIWWCATTGWAHRYLNKWQIVLHMQPWSAWVVVDPFWNQWEYRHLPRSKKSTGWYFRTPPARKLTKKTEIMKKNTSGLIRYATVTCSEIWSVCIYNSQWTDLDCPKSQVATLQHLDLSKRWNHAGGWQTRCGEHIPRDCLLNMLAEGVRDVYTLYNKLYKL